MLDYQCHLQGKVCQPSATLFRSTSSDHSDKILLDSLSLSFIGWRGGGCAYLCAKSSLQKSDQHVGRQGGFISILSKASLHVGAEHLTPAQRMNCVGHGSVHLTAAQRMNCVGHGSVHRTAAQRICSIGQGSVHPTAAQRIYSLGNGSVHLTVHNHTNRPLSEAADIAIIGIL